MAKAITLQPVNRCKVSFVIKGTSPLIMNKWSQKALSQLREKGGGRKTKTREARQPEAEAQECIYTTDEGDIGLPGMAFKCALTSAAHKDIGIEKTLVRKAIFLCTNDSNQVLPLDCDEPVIREDYVRVGQGGTDLRYRPQFNRWTCKIVLEVDGDLLQEGDVMNLVNRAGFGVGLCEWRPEKNGEYGRFEIAEDTPITWEQV